MKNQGWLQPFQPTRGLHKIMHFQVSYRKKTESELPDSSRLGFLKKFLAINFVSSDTEDNNSVENTIKI